MKEMEEKLINGHMYEYMDLWTNGWGKWTDGVVDGQIWVDRWINGITWSYRWCSWRSRVSLLLEFVSTNRRINNYNIWTKSVRISIYHPLSYSFIQYVVIHRHGIIVIEIVIERNII